MSLIFGIIWMCIALASFIVDPRFNYFAVIAGIVYFVDYFVRSQRQYALITEDFIQVNKFTAQRIYLQDIVEIKYFAGDYTIRAKDMTLVIDTNIVDKESIDGLKTQINNLMLRVRDCSEKPAARNERGLETKSPAEGNATHKTVKVIKS
jgi:hypothetical protein